MLGLPRELKKHQESDWQKKKMCPICWSTLEDTQNESLPCGHTYHADCIYEFCAIRGVHKLDVPCPECKLVPSVLISEARVRAFENCKESEPVIGAGEDSRGGVDIDLQSTPVSGQGSSIESESVPGPTPERMPQRVTEQAPNPKKRSKRETLLETKNLCKKPASAASSSSKSTGDSSSEVAMPEVAKRAASKGGQSGLFKFFNTCGLADNDQDASQCNNQNAHGGSKKRLRAKTHDESLPPAAPPSPKKQKAKAEGDTAQKDKAKKRKKRGGCRKGGRRGCTEKRKEIRRKSFVNALRRRFRSCYRSCFGKCFASGCAYIS